MIKRFLLLYCKVDIRYLFFFIGFLSVFSENLLARPRNTDIAKIAFSKQQELKQIVEQTLDEVRNEDGNPVSKEERERTVRAISTLLERAFRPDGPSANSPVTPPSFKFAQLEELRQCLCTIITCLDILKKKVGCPNPDLDCENLTCDELETIFDFLLCACRDLQNIESKICVVESKVDGLAVTICDKAESVIIQVGHTICDKVDSAIDVLGLTICDKAESVIVELGHTVCDKVDSAIDEISETVCVKVGSAIDEISDTICDKVSSAVEVLGETICDKVTSVVEVLGVTICDKAGSIIDELGRTITDQGDEILSKVCVVESKVDGLGVTVVDQATTIINNLGVTICDKAGSVIDELGQTITDSGDEILSKVCVVESKVDDLGVTIVDQATTVINDLGVTICDKADSIIDELGRTITDQGDDVLSKVCVVESKVDDLGVTVVDSTDPIFSKVCTIESKVCELADGQGCQPILEADFDIVLNTLTISVSASFCLQVSVVGSIIIDADDVTIDLNGHTLTAPDGLNAIEINGHTNITIKNGTIVTASGTDDHAGIFCNDSHGINLVDISFEGDGKGLEAVASTDLSLLNCKFLTLDVGLDLDSVFRFDVRSCAFFAGVNLAVVASSQEGVFRNCTFGGNDDNTDSTSTSVALHIESSSCITVHDCVVSNTIDAGIEVISSVGIVLRDNIVCDANPGYLLVSAEVLLQGCIAKKCTGDGFEVGAGAGSAVVFNACVALYNAGTGFIDSTGIGVNEYFSNISCGNTVANYSGILASIIKSPLGAVGVDNIDCSLLPVTNLLIIHSMIERIDSRVDQMDAKSGYMDSKIDHIVDVVGNMDSKSDHMDSKLDYLTDVVENQVVSLLDSLIACMSC